MHTFFTALLLSAVSLAELGPVPAGALRVYVVRHGQAYSNLTPEPALPPEQLDRLTALGHEQARRSGLALRDRGIALILSSPRTRTRETAEEIRLALGGAVELRLDERLRPLEMGRGPDGAELAWKDRWTGWELGRDRAPEGGESLEQLGQRMLALVAGLKAEAPDRSVVLVSHSEAIGNLVGMVEGVSLTDRFAARVPNASITVIESRPAALPRVLLSNYVPPEGPPAPGAPGGGPRAGAARPPAHRLAAP